MSSCDYLLNIIFLFKKKHVIRNYIIFNDKVFYNSLGKSHFLKYKGNNFILIIFKNSDI